MFCNPAKGAPHHLGKLAPEPSLARLRSSPILDSGPIATVQKIRTGRYLNSLTNCIIRDMILMVPLSGAERERDDLE